MEGGATEAGTVDGGAVAVNDGGAAVEAIDAW